MYSNIYQIRFTAKHAIANAFTMAIARAIVFVDWNTNRESRRFQVSAIWRFSVTRHRDRSCKDAKDDGIFSQNKHIERSAHERLRQAVSLLPVRWILGSINICTSNASPETRVFMAITLLRDDCLLCNSVLATARSARPMRANELEILTLNWLYPLTYFCTR